MNDDNKSRGLYLTAQRFFRSRSTCVLINPQNSIKETIFIFHHDSNENPKSPSRLLQTKKRHIKSEGGKYVLVKIDICEILGFIFFHYPSFCFRPQITTKSLYIRPFPFAHIHLNGF
jgi:hypothetical protein